AAKGERPGPDPWDGRTLEWATASSPPPYYNFAQLPLTRGLDPLWIEKTEGNGKITPAEPLGDVHMPNGSILPFVMSLGFFIAGFGFICQVHQAWGWIACDVGLWFVLGCLGP